MTLFTILLFCAILFSMKYLMQYTLTKLFHVKKEVYHKEFVNSTHKKVNFIIGGIFLLAFLYISYFHEANLTSSLIMLMICFFAIPSFIEAYFWWKDDKESKYFVLCIGEAVLFVVVGLMVWPFRMFGLLTI
ncbi:DUF4181 domain-containing protein [Bacillus sp. PS06]|uniref:DUF4181 domain-containing protein n=1 Tax=Bacillus sp. PS06 TaxID=2764176 RepID=UPI00177FEBA4|nr:DUF4181 domain-containing protein [Bacillus sp. PS06]MBD8069422.1 DUF4181 domain-containing protein [Bacillus sp. PS06]